MLGALRDVGWGNWEAVSRRVTGRNAPQIKTHFEASYSKTKTTAFLGDIENPFQDNGLNYTDNEVSAYWCANVVEKVKSEGLVRCNVNHPESLTEAAVKQ